ncbi:HNH endonuclease [Pseudomonas gessardii]|uniref:HNH endonuclease n=1 Tax=Pseudomonas gessardii TaxID=78544 RepID=UPI001475BDD8|nr:HNH endonuclease [Pseudomonas gessardii]NNA66200.1 HNH endonuclease [Pseudomonas gessardii]
MIKLNRATRPSFLTEQVTKELTLTFKTTGKSVWNDERLKVPLRLSSYGKCAYCECSIVEESKYMEVEHFKDKHSYPEDVIQWDNLLPSCKRCNGTKGIHDVIDTPIINPYLDLPRDHIYYRDYRLKGITEKGIDTIEAIGLNNYERIAIKRFEIGYAILESITHCEDKIKEYEATRKTRTLNKISRFMEGILNECQPSAIYAATTATIALNSETFSKVVMHMKSIKAWSIECEELLSIAKTIALPTALNSQSAPEITAQH